MSYTFITPQDKADFIFINECLLKKDFMSNISENPSENSFILIIKFKKKILVFLFLQFTLLRISNIVDHAFIF